MLPLKYTLKTTAKTTQNIIYENHKIQGLWSLARGLAFFARKCGRSYLMRGLRRLARKSDTSSETGLWVIWRMRGCCLLRDGAYGDSYGSLLRRARLAKERERVGRGAVWHFFTATAQTRTRETAEASNEIIPRGGASARVFAVKPSPFFDIFAAVCEKIGGRGGLLGRLLA